MFCCIKLHGNCSLVGDETLVERLKNSFKGSVENLFPQCSGIINFAGEIFLLGGGNLTRSDFDRSENYYLAGEMNLWWEEQKFVRGGFFLVGGEWANIWLVRGTHPSPIPPVGKTLTFAPEGPCCGATRHQIYWDHTCNVIFRSSLIWYYTHKDTQGSIAVVDPVEKSSGSNGLLIIITTDVISIVIIIIIIIAIIIIIIIISSL